MSYHAPHNMHSHIARTSQFELRHNENTGEITSAAWVRTKQDFYNGFAAVAAYTMVYGSLGFIAYHLAKPLISYIAIQMGSDLL